MRKMFLVAAIVFGFMFGMAPSATFAAPAKAVHTAKTVKTHAGKKAHKKAHKKHKGAKKHKKGAKKASKKNA